MGGLQVVPPPLPVPQPRFCAFLDCGVDVPVRGGSLFSQESKKEGENRVIAIRGPSQETEVPDYPADTTSTHSQIVLYSELLAFNCHRCSDIIREQ